MEMMARRLLMCYGACLLAFNANQHHGIHSIKHLVFGPKLNDAVCIIIINMLTIAEPIHVLCLLW